MSSTGFQSQMLWGLISQVYILKAGMPRVGSEPLVLREKLWFQVPCQLWDALLGVWFMVRLCLSLSYPLQYGFLLIHMMCKSCTASSEDFFQSKLFHI